VIPIRRLDEPEILRKKRAKWTADFLAGTDERPHPSKYRHHEIVETLGAMSHQKCFYCEERPAKLTVDHYIEAAERRDLAFTWSNLYLACHDCQSKIRHTSIPVTDCVDPCEAGVQPAMHLWFQRWRAKWHTDRGEHTVRKYKLNEASQLAKRNVAFGEFTQVLLAIKDAQIAAGGRPITASELSKLRRFAEPDEPFSLMFACYLRSEGLLP
jgi:hypothetical protein